MRKIVVRIGGIIGLFAFFIVLMPFFYMLINSLKTRREILLNATSLPNEFMFSNYPTALNKIDFGQAFLNSFIITSVSLLLLVIFSSMTAWVLVRTKSKMSSFLFYILIAAMVVPFQAVMLPLIQLMSKIEFTLFGYSFHMLRSYYGIIIMYIGFGSSLSVFLYHGFIKGIPVELEEAAIMDGCSKWQLYWKIIFPILKPITITVLVLNGIWIWNDYLLPQLTLGGTIVTIPLATSMFFGQFIKQWELAMAALTVAIVPVIILYLVAQKYIIKGIISGSIK